MTCYGDLLGGGGRVSQFSFNPELEIATFGDCLPPPPLGESPSPVTLPIPAQNFFSPCSYNGNVSFVGHSET